MTQSVVVQVGQCGNQIGCCFWDLALRKGIYDEAIGSFFRNVDTRVVGDGSNISRGKIRSLKARHFSSVITSLQQAFSMIVGTGSGLGTLLLKVLENELPEVFRFVTSMYPASEDDVMTSPYNSMLAMKELQEHTDCVLPIDNQAHLHHYLQVEGMEESYFAEAMSSLSALIQEYHELHATKNMPGYDIPRLSIAV